MNRYAVPDNPLSNNLSGARNTVTPIALIIPASVSMIKSESLNLSFTAFTFIIPPACLLASPLI